MNKDPLGRWKNAWLITVNTNSVDERYKVALKGIWNLVVQNINYFMVYRTGGRLIGVKEKSAVEVGKKFHRIHLHSFLEVEAYGLANLDYGLVKNYINMQLRGVNEKFAGIHFNAKLVKNYNASVMIKEYLEKDEE